MTVFEKVSGALTGSRKAREVGDNSFGEAQKRIEENKRRATNARIAEEVVRPVKKMMAGWKDSKERGWKDFTNSLFDTKAIAAASGGGMLRK